MMESFFTFSLWSSLMGKAKCSTTPSCSNRQGYQCLFAGWRWVRVTFLIAALNQLKSFTFCEFSDIQKKPQKRCLYFQDSLFSHKMIEDILSSTVIYVSISFSLWLEKLNYCNVWYGSGSALPVELELKFY